MYYIHTGRHLMHCRYVSSRLCLVQRSDSNSDSLSESEDSAHPWTRTEFDEASGVLMILNRQLPGTVDRLTCKN